MFMSTTMYEVMERNIGKSVEVILVDGTRIRAVPRSGMSRGADCLFLQDHIGYIYIPYTNVLYIRTLMDIEKESGS